ncbi:MAG: hypothetical protein ABL893_11170 [Hyphomicrobium sp.]
MALRNESDLSLPDEAERLACQGKMVWHKCGEHYYTAYGTYHMKVVFRIPGDRQERHEKNWHWSVSRLDGADLASGQCKLRHMAHLTAARVAYQLSRGA